MKSYTDLEQSKKLAEILPLESADMYYPYYHNPISGTSYYEEYPIFHIPINKNKSLPCWGLAALYGILPNNKKESTTLSRGGWKIEPPEYIDNWWCEYEDDRHAEDFTVSADNPVDACYEMILKLHELNLL